MATEIDFSSRKSFPGETGNLLDVLLHAFNRINNIPAIPFAILLLGIAAPHAFSGWKIVFILYVFFLGDWLLLALLPHAGKSFGPAKPPGFLLAIMRSLAALIPGFLFIPVQILGTLLVIYGFWIEPHRIRVTRQYFSSPKFQPSRPLLLLHLGDLHIERITGRERQLQRLIEQLRPDLILFSGDILNLSYRQDPKAILEARTVLSQWKAPLGVYVVNGSPAVDLAEVFPRVVEDLPLHWLNNEKISLQHGHASFDLIGLSCTHRPHIDASALDQLVESGNNRFNILLYHSPDLAPIAAKKGIDLQLSGHTHGGQVRLPLFGALLTGSLYGKQFEAGRITLGSMTLYVTRGLGLEGAGAPRVRFLCPPEIILWEIS